MSSISSNENPDARVMNHQVLSWPGQLVLSLCQPSPAQHCSPDRSAWFRILRWKALVCSILVFIGAASRGLLLCHWTCNVLKILALAICSAAAYSLVRWLEFGL